MAEPSGPPPRFRPETVRDALCFAIRGRALLRHAIESIAAAPAATTAAELATLQRTAAVALLRHLRVDFHTTGLEHVTPTPGIVIALHEGIVDALCLCALPIALRFVARREIFAWPEFGPMLQRAQHIAVRPEAGASEYRPLLRAVRAAIHEGLHVVIFPQGTLLGIETAFQRGAFVLARTLGTSIQPIVITGTHRVWEHPFSPTLRYGQSVRMDVLPAVSASTVLRADPGGLRVDLQRRMKGVALASDRPSARRYIPSRDGNWDGFRFDIDPEFSLGRSASVRASVPSALEIPAPDRDVSPRTLQEP